jgi:predicted nucleic acid-binding Zn ribbon protein
MNRPSPEECANCGAAIPRGAKACPECGADERTGWRENAESVYDGLDLPDEAFEDGKTKRAQGPRARRVNGVPWYWWLVGVLLLLSLVAWALGLG